MFNVLNNKQMLRFVVKSQYRLNIHRTKENGLPALPKLGEYFWWTTLGGLDVPVNHCCSHNNLLDTSFRHAVFKLTKQIEEILYTKNRFYAKCTGCQFRIISE